MALILLQLTSKNIGFVMPETWASVRNLDPGPHTVDLHLLCRQRPVTPKAARPVHLGYNMERSRLFAVKWGYTHMLIVQSDIIFPPNTLQVLMKVMEQHKAGLVCPLTPERPEKVKTDNFVVCMSWNNNPHARAAINKGQPFRITGNGSGYMLVLIDRSVFARHEFPRTACSDVNWYAKLRKAGVKMICEVGLRIFHKQRGDGQIIRGNEYVVKHWREVIEANNKSGREWCHGLLGTWWNGLSGQEFLKQLPAHIDENRAWWSW